MKFLSIFLASILITGSIGIFNFGNAFAEQYSYIDTENYRLISSPNICVYKFEDKTMPDAWSAIAPETSMAIASWGSKLSRYTGNEDAWIFHIYSIPIKNKYSTDPRLCDIAISFLPKPFNDAVDPFSALGVTEFVGEGMSNILIYYNSIDPSGQFYENKLPPLPELRATIEHELGHAFGLDHVELSQNDFTKLGEKTFLASTIMGVEDSSVVFYTDDKVRYEITDYDVRAVVNLYGNDGFGPVQDLKDRKDRMWFYFENEDEIIFSNRIIPKEELFPQNNDYFGSLNSEPETEEFVSETSIPPASSFNQISSNFVNTNHASYVDGVEIVISGHVEKTTESFVIIQIKSPNGNLVHVDQPAVDSAGNFQTSFTAGGTMKETGTYSIAMTYGGDSSSAIFEFQPVGSISQPPHVLPPVDSTPFPSIGSIEIDVPTSVDDLSTQQLVIFIFATFIAVIVIAILAAKRRASKRRNNEVINEYEPLFETSKTKDSENENILVDRIVKQRGSFSKIEFNYESELEAILEFDYKNPTKSVDRMFFGKKNDTKIYSRDYLQTSNNNFAHIRIIPSPKRSIASFEYGGSKSIGDNFEAGYTLVITLKYSEPKLRRFLIDIMNKHNFGCLPASTTIHCHLNSAHPTEDQAKKILEEIVIDIPGKPAPIKITEDDPMTILKKRYATGELSDEKFLEMKQTLES